mgnify:FL=1
MIISARVSEELAAKVKEQAARYGETVSVYTSKLVAEAVYAIEERRAIRSDAIDPVTPAPPLPPA